nr:MAG TPA: hypothetical protein [Caudoviricetes sp.]
MSDFVLDSGRNLSYYGEGLLKCNAMSHQLKN